MTAISLKAVAGATLPLVADYTADGAAGLLEDGTNPPVRSFLNDFPYIGTPYSGFNAGT